MFNVVSGLPVGSVVNGPSVSKAGVTDAANCYEATVVLAKQSPFIYGLIDADRVSNNNTIYNTIIKLVIALN